MSLVKTEVLWGAEAPPPANAGQLIYLGAVTERDSHIVEVEVKSDTILCLGISQ